MSESALIPPSYTIATLAGDRLLGRKLFHFRVLKALVDCLLASVQPLKSLNTFSVLDLFSVARFILLWKLVDSSVVSSGLHLPRYARNRSVFVRCVGGPLQPDSCGLGSGKSFLNGFADAFLPSIFSVFSLGTSCRSFFKNSDV